MHSTSEHAPGESVDGVLGSLLPDLDQSIRELKQSAVIFNIRCTDTIRRIG